MTRYQSLVSDYLLERRQFGYDLRTEERILKRFAEFADEQQYEFLDGHCFLEWKDRFGSANQNTWKGRLSTIREFSIWLTHIDSKTQPPSAALISGQRFRRKKAYIYSDLDIQNLLFEAMRLRSKLGLRALALHTLYGFLLVTGLRINEALGIKLHHIDFSKKYVIIPKGKTCGSRNIPFSQSTADKLLGYHKQRMRLTEACSEKFFVVENGREVTEYTARYSFAQIGQKIGLREGQKFGRHGKGPRLHDFRHTFAFNTLRTAYEENRDIDQEMYKLCNFLGHHSIESTYWYIQSVPELLSLAMRRSSLEFGSSR